MQELLDTESWCGCLDDSLHDRQIISRKGKEAQQACDQSASMHTDLSCNVRANRHVLHFLVLPEILMLSSVKVHQCFHAAMLTRTSAVNTQSLCMDNLNMKSHEVT